LLKNMMATMEVLGVDPEDEVEAEQSSNSNAAAQSTADSSPDYKDDSGTVPPPRKGAYAAITAGPQAPTPGSLAEKGQKKKKGLTPEQKQKLQQIQHEQETIRQERVAILSQKLLEKISVWIETDRSQIVTEAFKKKMEVIKQYLLSLIDHQVRSGSTEA